MIITATKTVDNMKKYDMIVICGRASSIVAENPLRHKIIVALVNKLHPEETCQNFGCISSEKLMYLVDSVVEILEAKKPSVEATVSHINIHAIMNRKKKIRKESQEEMKKEKIEKEVEKWNAKRTYPILIMNNRCIPGFKKDYMSGGN